jgi:hypothetical protein
MKNQFRTKLKLSVLSLGLTFAFLGASAQADPCPMNWRACSQTLRAPVRFRQR